MTIPKGTRFHNRRGAFTGGYGFDCERTGHKRQRYTFTHKSDREDFIVEHDQKYHSGRPHSEEVTLEAATGAHLEEMRQLVRRQERSWKTLRYYEDIAETLKEHLGAETTLEEIRQPEINEFIRSFRMGSTSQGARIKKHLSALRTFFHAAGYPPHWTIPKTLKVTHREAQPLDDATLLRFWRALPKGSVEQAFVTSKWVLALRNVELQDANVGDMDLAGAKWRYEVRAKAVKEWRVVHVPAYLVEMLRPWVEGRHPEAPLFHIRDGRLLDSSLRKRFIAASRRAGIHPPITAVANLRHVAFAKIEAEMDIYAAQALAGHKSVRTTESYVNKQRRASGRAKDASEALADLLETDTVH